MFNQNQESSMLTHFLYLFAILISFLIAIYYFRKYKKIGANYSKEVDEKLAEHQLKLTPLDVKSFYNKNTDKFLEVYGEIIQAYRTKDVNDYLNYTIISADIKDGQTILDAGCGVGGPACYFAAAKNITIKGCTISEIQAEKANIKILERALQDKVEIQCADYHEINRIYPKEYFDRVLFLESFGHSPYKLKLIDAAWDVLKPGGYLYIKDLFIREAGGDEDMKRIKEICLEINSAYEYAIADLHEIISAIRKKGYILTFIKTPEINLDIFEHLTISNQFQELFNIAKIESWENYIFPIDFLEIKCQKPTFMVDFDKHLYHDNR